MNRIIKNFGIISPAFSGSMNLTHSTLQSRAGICRLRVNFDGEHGCLKNKFVLPVALHSRRNFSSKHSKKNFYKILAVSTKATQAQIKAAYYDLSLKHHPDRHKGSQKAHNMFHEISEAYSVLGSLDSRKQYDRALIVEGVLSPEQARPFHAPLKPSASIYDFDEWAKQHYFQALLRKQKDKRERKDDEIERSLHRIPEGSFRLICLAVFLAIAVAGIYSQKYTIQKNQDRNKE